MSVQQLWVSRAKTPGHLVRLQEGGQRRVLDGAARQRRLARQLDALEMDNFQEDPHSPQLLLAGPAARLPSFQDPEQPGRKRKKLRGDHFKLRFRKTFQALLEEEVGEWNLSAASEGGPSYVTVGVPPSPRPPRRFCAVCGFPAAYTCVSCGARCCCVHCLAVHHDTRCLKWTV
ncbi:unnamed protein product [Lampetra fluviatilis]